MINIAICDSDGFFRTNLKDAAAEYLTKKSISFNIDIYSSGEELIALGIEMLLYTMVFLDIDISNMGGMAAAKRIRKVNSEIFIVLVTVHMDYILEGYKVGAFRYLMKNRSDFPESLDECLGAAIAKMDYKVVKKTFKYKEGIKEIPIERILYIESRLHKLEFHIMENELKIYTMYETLNQVEKELEGNSFARIHQSFLVNVKYIREVSRYKAVLCNGIELAIPKARYHQVKGLLAAYQGGSGKTYKNSSFSAK